MTIKWFYPATNYPTITIAKYGITFNIGCITYLKTGGSLVLGCDTENNRVHIKISADEGTEGFIIPEITEDIKTVRISCKEFVRFLQVRCGLDLEKPKKYYTDFDEKNNEFIIDINAPIPGKRQIRTTIREG